MSEPRSYLLCGTPRTGSTLLCDLLASTGVAGHPESYFREPEQADWAARLGVAVARDGAVDLGELVAAAIGEGTTANGVFGARIMWGPWIFSLAGSTRRSRTARTSTSSKRRSGNSPLVHLRRLDVVRQAVSWVRAEQTGYWQQGDTASAEPHLDLGQVDHFVRTIREQDAAWSAWFSSQGVRPHLVAYEDLVEDPSGTVKRLLDRLEVEPPPGWAPASAVARQGDELNDDWVRRYDEQRSCPTSAAEPSVGQGWAGQR